MIYVFFANGCEEMEAVAPVDILRRAGLAVTTVGIGGTSVTGAHGITLSADISEEEMSRDGLSLLVLPGGGGGTEELKKSPRVADILRHAHGADIPIAAICAAPTVLGKLGLLAGKRAISYPGTEDELTGADVRKGTSVVRDGNLITAEGPGAAIPFALALVELLKGPEAAAAIASDLCFHA